MAECFLAVYQFVLWQVSLQPPISFFKLIFYFKLIFSIILGHDSLFFVTSGAHTILYHIEADFNRIEPKVSENFEYDSLVGQLFKVILGIRTIYFE